MLGNHTQAAVDYLGLCYETVEEAIIGGYTEATIKTLRDYHPAEGLGYKVPWVREWCGIVCKCDNGKEVRYCYSEPHPGLWTGPRRIPRGNELAQYKKFKDWYHPILTFDVDGRAQPGAECDPKSTIDGDAVSCERVFGKGWVFAGTYHSHPPVVPTGGGEESKSDRETQHKHGEVWGVGWPDLDESGTATVIGGVIVYPVTDPPRSDGGLDIGIVQEPVPLPRSPHTN